MASTEKNRDFKLEFLDHVAIRVRDVQASARWYERVLGLSRCQKEAWGDFPVFMMAGTSGIALFPAHLQDPPLHPDSRNIKIDHFAFHIAKEDFERAQAHFETLGLQYQVQDHHYFHSLYTRDPDGHTVELTALVADPGDFYGP